MIGKAWQELARRAWEPEAKGLARWLSAVSLPQSWVYMALVAWRARSYALGRKKTATAPLPVISIGNLAAGGTGKTPLTLHLARGLISRGLKPAVLTRGYGGRAGAGPLPVEAGMDPAQTGDEPLELAALEGLMVVAGYDRAAGAALAALKGADVLLLDDGFQHLKLARDLNIALIDAQFPFANRRCLPAGPLREPIPALGRADAFVMTRSGGLNDETSRQTLNHRFPNRPVWAAAHQLEGLFSPAGDRLDETGRTALVVAGVARPESVALSVRGTDVKKTELLAFEDHQVYGPAEVELINRRLAETKADLVVTTAKDWTKLQAWSARLNAPVGLARLKLTINGEEELWTKIDQTLAGQGAVPGVWRRTTRLLSKTGRLIVRLPNWIGDAVMAAPVLANLRRALPGWRISALGKAWTAPLFQADPNIDRLIIYEDTGRHQGLSGRRLLARQIGPDHDAGLLLPNSFDSALIFRLAKLSRRIGYARDGRSLLLTDPVGVTEPLLKGHHLEYYLGLLTYLNLETPIRTPEIHLSEADQAWAQTWLNDQGLTGQALIGLAPGAAFGPAKQWPKEYFAQAAARLAGETKGPVLIFGSDQDKPLARQIAAEAGVKAHNLAGAFSLGRSAALIQNLNLLLSNDSGLMHLAVALKTPTLAMFGPTDPTRTSPRGGPHRLLIAPAECAPCQQKTCPKGRTCLYDISVDQAVEAGLELMAD